MRQYERNIHEMWVTNFYPCGQCEFITHNRQSMKFHKQSKHDGITYPCIIRDHKATRTQSLKHHMKMKQGKLEKEKFGLCDFKIHNKGSMKLHNQVGLN